MKLHTVFITYNRLELTKRAIASYLETVTLPFSISIVDNASDDGTAEWIMGGIGVGHRSHILAANRYPGYACNLGWGEAPADATHLHRADNDFIFLPGWCNEVKRKFRNQKVGQVGLRTGDEELHNSNNVGGNCILKRELWVKGLRYDERPWPQISEEVGKGWSEDGLLSPAVREMGYRWVRVDKPCIQPISSVDPEDPYYVRSLGDRGVEL